MSAGERAARPLRPIVQVLGFLRKELVDISRQPRALVVLVVGPFLILLAFAAGYEQDSTQLRTQFVGPESGLYEKALDEQSDNLDQYMDSVGITDDRAEAERALQAGEVDLVVVFPPEPEASVLEGDQAVITVLHDKLDPLLQTAVRISAQIAVQEINASVLEELVGNAQGALTPLDEGLDRTEELVDELETAAARDPEGTGEVAADLRATLTALDTLATVSDRAINDLRGETDPSRQERLVEFRSAITETEAALDDAESASSPTEAVAAYSRAGESAATLRQLASEVEVIDPGVLTRPFRSNTENVLDDVPTQSDFFAPSAISLLLQHLAVTFAALTLVRDRALGLFETFRVAPVASHHVIAGKYLSYLVLGGAVAAALVASVVSLLGVPLHGSIIWLAAGIALLLVASIGLGLILSSLSGSDTQAVQFAMLLLLAGLFFGGFFLSLDAFRYPIRLVAWFLPVTHAIRMLQDVMLRGDEPAVADVVGLTSLTVLFGATAWFLLSRRLRVR